MTCLLWTLLGLFVGGTLGVLTGGILCASGRASEAERIREAWVSGWKADWVMELQDMHPGTAKEIATEKLRKLGLMPEENDE